jgi:hypothetical protein
VGNATTTTGNRTRSVAPTMRTTGGHRVDACGQALLVSLLILLVLAALAAVIVKFALLDAQMRAGADASERQRLAAESGIEYALWAFEHADWLYRERPFSVSRTIDGHEVAVSVEDGVPGSTISLASAARARDRSTARTISAEVTDPSDLLRYVRNVYGFDYEARKPLDLTVQFGDENSSAAGIIEEILTIPASRRVALACLADPAYYCLAPARDAVIDANGRPFRRTGVAAPDETVPIGSRFKKLPGLQGPGEYVIDYARAGLIFHSNDVGTPVCVYYDYYRRIPPPPGPYAVGLPYAPVREGSDVVYSPTGASLFVRDMILPQAAGRYLIDYQNGALAFSQQNANQPVGIVYSFLGSRYTGPLRINGNAYFDRRNLFYFFRSRGDRMEITGTYRFSSQARVQAFHDAGGYVDALVNPGDSFVARAERKVAPPLGLAYARRLADPKRGGDGCYLANGGDVEDLEAAARRWQAAGGSRKVVPPGVLLDLERMPYPHNGVVFAEGNVRVRGRLRARTRLTVVSRGVIYIEGNIVKRDQDSSLALLARDHVCLNASAFPTTESPVSQELGIVNAQVDALIYAHRGSFGVIPGPGEHRQFVFRGALSENTPYSPQEWAKAFESIEYIYDGSFRLQGKRPPWLVMLLSYREGGGQEPRGPSSQPPPPGGKGRAL